MNLCDNAVLAVLTELLVEVRRSNQLLALIAERFASPKAVLRPSDHGLLMLLPRIAASYGDRMTFTVRDLLRHAEDDPELRVALKHLFGSLDQKSAQRAGAVFRRVAGNCHDGYRLERVGTIRAGGLYLVRRD